MRRLIRCSKGVRRSKRADVYPGVIWKRLGACADYLFMRMAFEAALLSY